MTHWAILKFLGIVCVTSAWSCRWRKDQADLRHLEWPKCKPWMMLVCHYALHGASLRISEVMGSTWDLNFQRDPGKARMSSVVFDE